MMTLALAVPRADAALVETRTGRVQGILAWEKDHVTVDGKKVDWADVLYLLNDPTDRTTTTGSIVRLKSGEAWTAEILAVSDKKVAVRSPKLGEMKLDLAQVAELDFLPSEARPADLKAETLYRLKGEPVPGTLLALDGERLTMDSPLGEVKLPRKGLTRYVVALPPSLARVEKAIDEVALTDGSIFRGTLRVVDGALELEHGLLGKMKLTPATLRSVVRRSPDAIDLTALTPRSAETAPLLGTTTGPARYDRLDAEQRSALRCLDGLRIEPKTTLSYTLPKSEGKKRKLRLTLACPEGARGDAKLRVRLGDRTVIEQEAKAGAAPQSVVVELPAGDELTIEVEFGARLRFPCGVVLADAFLLTER
jgi:hypothetical protein